MRARSSPINAMPFNYGQVLDTIINYDNIITCIYAPKSTCLWVMCVGGKGSLAYYMDWL